MPAQRIAMRRIREVLRLRLEAGLSFRQISKSSKLSVGSIQKLTKKAEQLGLTWPLPETMDDTQLASLFYPRSDTKPARRREVPDWATAHQELKRKGMTKQLLWQEYTERYPNRCYSYSQYCDRYRQWCTQQRRSMRQVHQAGEKIFIDYAGTTVPVVNPDTGEVRETQIFVAVLGASNYTYAEATASQSLPDWLQSHVRMFEFFGGCSELLIPDNLRSGVSKACRYDPDLNPAYQQLASHYGVAVMPARPYKPKDKSKAENAVLLVERWILMRLRHQTFFTLGELNHCIGSLLRELNHKPFKQLPGCRRDAFEQLDKPALHSLPAQPYRYVDIKTVKVNIDYHVQYKQHHYSVPHHYVGEKLELHAGDTLMQIYFRQQLIATHPRKFHSGSSTETGHMPTRHSRQQQWTPARLKQWAGSIGEQTRCWIQWQLDAKPHPEQAYRICLGLLSLSRSYPACRVEAACKLANSEGLYRLRQIKSILKANRDQLPDQPAQSTTLPQEHENIRGPETFH